MRPKSNKSNPALGGGVPENTKMRKTKIYTIVLLVGIGLIAGALISKKGELFDKETNDDIKPAEVKTETTKDKNIVNGHSSLEGVLQASEDAKLGNFKLVSGDSEIYIRTSRDFSKLVGLQVLVLINGTLDNFQLLDMQPAVQKDGFIISH